MIQAKSGDRVKVHYTGKLPNNEIFDTSENEQPFEFTIGSKTVIPGFEKAIIGMEVGETKTITLPPEEAYGSRYKELVLDFKKNAFSDNITFVVGEQIKIRQKDRDPIKVTVANMDDDTITFDANHPLAGETLIFTIRLVAVT
ncbi:MAG: peptidylprolyl isomerase [Desulfatiglandales bacterium]|jgi:peptidylprolyl isomerase